MTEPVETDHAAAMMAVLEEIVAGSRGLVSDWALLTHAQAALERGGLEGLSASTEQPSNNPAPAQRGSRPLSRPITARRWRLSTHASWPSIRGHCRRKARATRTVDDQPGAHEVDSRARVSARCHIDIRRRSYNPAVRNTRPSPAVLALGGRRSRPPEPPSVGGPRNRYQQRFRALDSPAPSPCPSRRVPG